MPGRIAAGAISDSGHGGPAAGEEDGSYSGDPGEQGEKRNEGWAGRAEHDEDEPEDIQIDGPDGKDAPVVAGAPSEKVVQDLINRFVEHNDLAKVCG